MSRIKVYKMILMCVVLSLLLFQLVPFGTDAVLHSSGWQSHFQKSFFQKSPNDIEQAIRSESNIKTLEATKLHEEPLFIGVNKVVRYWTYENYKELWQFFDHRDRFIWMTSAHDIEGRCF